MSTKLIGTFLWGNTNIQTFLYGSDLMRLTNDRIEFRNHLMPAGTPIHEWYSYTHFSVNRDMPQLPYLYVGKTYQIEPDIHTFPEHCYLLEIIFYDRYEHKVETQVLHPPYFTFTYPENSFFYTIRLINAGCSKLIFSNFQLYEVLNEND